MLMPMVAKSVYVVALYPLQHLLFVLLMVPILTGVKCNLKVVLLLIFIGLMAKNADHFFSSIYWLLYFCIENCLFCSFIYLLSGSLLKDEQNTSVKLSHILESAILHGAWLQMNKALSISISHFMLCRQGSSLDQ